MGREMPLTPEDVPSLIARYEASILLGDQFALHQVAKANRQSDKSWRILRLLAVTPGGRRAVSGLTDSPHASVRLAAAGGSLPWEAQRGVAALEQLVAERSYRVSSFARMVLLMYRSGTFRWISEAGQIMSGPLEASTPSPVSPVDQYGWEPIVRDGAELAYTVGMWRTFGRPEVVVSGLPTSRARDFLDLAVGGERVGFPLDPGLIDGKELVSLRRAPGLQYARALIVVPLEGPNRSRLTEAVRLYNGLDFAAVQVVWAAGEAGPFPWDSDAPADYRSAQGLFFDTPVHGWRPAPRLAEPGEPLDERFEAVASFHSLVMNGGFLDAFAVMPDKLDLVAAGLDALRLSKAAELVRTGIGLMASSSTVDQLPDADAARLEALGDRYTDLVTDDILFGLIDAIEEPTAD